MYFIVMVQLSDNLCQISGILKLIMADSFLNLIELKFFMSYTSLKQHVLFHSKWSSDLVWFSKYQAYLSQLWPIVDHFELDQVEIFKDISPLETAHFVFIVMA